MDVQISVQAPLKLRCDVWQSTAAAQMVKTASGSLLPVVEIPAQSITTVILY